MKLRVYIIALGLSLSILCQQTIAQERNSISPEQDLISAITVSVSGFESHKRIGQSADDLAYKYSFIRSMTEALSTYYYNMALLDVGKKTTSASAVPKIDVDPILTTLIDLQDILEAHPANPQDYDAVWEAKFVHALELHLLQVRALLYSTASQGQELDIQERDYTSRPNQYSGVQLKAFELRKQIDSKIRKNAKVEVKKADNAWDKAQYERATHYYTSAIKTSSSSVRHIGARPKF